MMLRESGNSSSEEEYDNEEESEEVKHVEIQFIDRSPGESVENSESIRPFSRSESSQSHQNPSEVASPSRRMANFSPQ
jgi:hypothetical protein